jgi:hypothetical protein
MKIEWPEPSARFDATSFSDVNEDGTAGPSTTVYTCSRCETKLGFTRDNFLVRAARRLTKLAAKAASALDGAAAKRGLQADNFLDWSCPSCKLAVRAYARVLAGGRHGDGRVDIVAVVELLDVA